ncbi:HD domain-containing phosphohydrolase [Hydrogenivirga sp.]
MNLEFFIKLLELRDAYTKGHTEKGVLYALEIGKSLGLKEDELKELEIGGYIHDVGKVAIPDVILLKPTRLTPKEYEVMKLHVKLGHELVKGLELPQGSIDVLLYHQEKYDGTGYPFGKKGEEIPLLARIYTVADSFEAMTARRIYKRSKPWDVALRELEELAGRHFDPDIVPHAVKVLSGMKDSVVTIPEVDAEIDKIRWSFYYMDFTGAIKGDLFVPTLEAFIEKGEPFCFTIFDIQNLFEINRKFGWEKGNEALTKLVEVINLQCCAMYDIRDLVIKLMKVDILDITSPVIFRLGGDEIGVIAPFIPPPEKVQSVANFMEEEGVKLKFLQVKYPENFKTAEEVLHLISEFTKSPEIRLNFS